jgi:hypothetical protein
MSVPGQGALRGSVLMLYRSFLVVGSKATATFTSQGGKQEVLVMHGNWLDTTADIVDESMGG